MKLPPWFPSDDYPEALMRVRTEGAGVHPVPDTLVAALLGAGPAIAAAAAFVVPLTTEEACGTDKSFPDNRLSCMQGTKVGDTCCCGFCWEPLGERAFRCPTCKSSYQEIMIACEKCHDEMTSDSEKSLTDAQTACRTAGHVREFLDFRDVPQDARACNLCVKGIPLGTSWVGAGGPRDPDVCVACAETPEGRAYIQQNQLRLRSGTQLRGINEALGPGPFGTWVPILRGIELSQGSQKDEDGYVSDDVDLYNEYAEVWVNLDPQAQYPVMISIGDDHGRQGCFGLSQTLPQLLASLSLCSPVRIVYGLDYPIYYG